MSDAEKITDLEIAMTHHDKILNDLSEVMNLQWKEIEALKKQLAKANTKIEELENSSIQGDDANVRPPHW